MRILLDTSVLLRLAISPSLLSQEVHRSIVEAEQLYVSAISRAEIGIKLSVGKLQLPAPEPEFWEQVTARLQADHLPFEASHAARLADMPLHHRDPFDRMIVAQCIVEELALATTDRSLQAYGIKTL